MAFFADLLEREENFVNIVRRDADASILNFKADNLRWRGRGRACGWRRIADLNFERHRAFFGEFNRVAQ